MKRFEFPLRAVLTLRKLNQEQALEAYAAAVSEFNAAQDTLAKATSQMEQLTRQLGQQMGDRFSGAMRETYMRALEASRAEAEALKVQLEQAASKRDLRLKEYIEQKRKVEIISHLKDKQEAAHTAAELRKEELEVEEIVVSRLRTLT